jgi:hypothetical protein
MKRKDFDCVVMKDEIQKIVMKEQANWTVEKTLEFYNKIYKEMVSKKTLSGKKQLSKRKNIPVT